MPVERAGGIQVFLVTAPTKVKAEAKFKANGGERVLYEEVEVTELDTENAEVIGEHIPEQPPPQPPPFAVGQDVWVRCVVHATGNGTTVVKIANSLFVVPLSALRRGEE